MSEATDGTSGPADTGKFERDRARVESGFWPKIRRLAAKVPFLNDLVAAYYCALDPKSPFQVRAVLMGALAYFVLPVDIIPDFIALFGFADDATVLYGAVKTVAKHITPEHREKAAAAIAMLET
ncbi:YkvA family protein [Dongia sp.]|uniref:YkvA family protein n=1 Tax=Dongia sp. TaxID=1977262 RepID=UPI0035B2649B